MVRKRKVTWSKTSPIPRDIALLDEKDYVRGKKHEIAKFGKDYGFKSSTLMPPPSRPYASKLLMSTGKKMYKNMEYSVYVSARINKRTMEPYLMIRFFSASRKKSLGYHKITLRRLLDLFSLHTVLFFNGRDFVDVKDKRRKYSIEDTVAYAYDVYRKRSSKMEEPISRRGSNAGEKGASRRVKSQ